MKKMLISIVVAACSVALAAPAFATHPPRWSRSPVHHVAK